MIQDSLCTTFILNNPRQQLEKKLGRFRCEPEKMDTAFQDGFVSRHDLRYYKTEPGRSRKSFTGYWFALNSFKPTFSAKIVHFRIQIFK